MTLRTLPFYLFASALLAQAPVPPSAVPPQPAELKAALGLSDQQIGQLQQLQRDRAQATLPVAEQIGVKQKALQDSLRAGNTDAAALGRQLLDIENLRKQFPEIEKRYREQALQLLSADQRTKLKSLEDLMKSRPAADQAVRLNLLEGPAQPPMPPGPPMGFRGMFGAPPPPPPRFQ